MRNICSLVCFSLLFSFSASSRADIGVYNDAARFAAVTDMGEPLTFEREFASGTHSGDLYLTETTAPGGVAAVWTERGTSIVSSHAYFIWRDYSELESGFIYGARFDLGQPPTTYLEVVPPAGSTAVSLNLTGFYADPACDVLRIEVRTADGGSFEFSHSPRASPTAWAVPSGNGFLGVVANVPIEALRINVVESTTPYTYDFVILDNVAAGYAVDASAFGHVPSEFNGCYPDSYPFARVDMTCDADLSECFAQLDQSRADTGACEQALAAVEPEVVVEVVEVPVEVVRIEYVEVPVEKIVEVEVCNSPGGEEAASSSSRSGLGDGTNPGRGKGRERSPNAGTRNPSRRR